MKDWLFSLPDIAIITMISGFLLLGIYLTFKSIKTLKTNRSNRKIVLLIPFVFHIINIFLIDELLTVDPSTSSGNGNPAIPYVFISLTLLITFCIIVFYKTREVLQDKSNLSKKSIVLVASLIFCFVAIYFQMDFVSYVNEKLYYPMGDWWNWWKDIHLNNLYLNVYTFLFGLSMAIAIASALSLLRPEN
ncbi:hypothetical protein CIB95_04255 [Lottiidibacillus patelloidae]|uniref:Uncharacterized protein n=1 Tax=Lottiidibacillus patelloidae TaxID=2670334 RepID=A0A263BV50_9BACI|nr:hypothetical protein [Lottiidibacillus patelloidae]OZM57590.1 hypothetical protein CIB95_04255 [Lottiidibacillus patelloidae]